MVARAVHTALNDKSLRTRMREIGLKRAKRLLRFVKKSCSKTRVRVNVNTLSLEGIGAKICKSSGES